MKQVQTVATNSKKADITESNAHPIDVHVGRRIRLRRMLLGLSQERLADGMGISFQQIQKYEKGSNRISASRLLELSQVLDVPVQFFFDEMPSGHGTATNGGRARDTQVALSEFLITQEAMDLNRTFLEIECKDVRRSVLNLIRRLASDSRITNGRSCKR